MLVFELAWIYLAERQFEEAADTFLRMMHLNNWFVSLPECHHALLISTLWSLGVTQHTRSWQLV
jgi:hypothetical protein